MPRCPATQCERGGGTLALAGTPNADSALWASVSITAVSVRRLSGSACVALSGSRVHCADSTGGVDVRRHRRAVSPNLPNRRSRAMPLRGAAGAAATGLSVDDARPARRAVVAGQLAQISNTQSAHRLCCMCASLSATRCPARGHRLRGAYGLANAIGYRRALAGRQLARDRRL
jgi:hypothetical protein